MINWSQQMVIIESVFKSFQKGEKTTVEFSANLDKNKFFLNPSKFEQFTISNFKILLYNIMYTESPKGLVAFLVRLNKVGKQNEEDGWDFRKDVSNANKFRQEILTYAYIKQKDERTLETLNITPYKAFKKKLIHPFTLADYYKINDTQIKGRMMVKDVTDALILRSYFKI